MLNAPRHSAHTRKDEVANADFVLLKPKTAKRGREAGHFPQLPLNAEKKTVSA
jgi:hypothetical protein